MIYLLYENGRFKTIKPTQHVYQKEFVKTRLWMQIRTFSYVNDFKVLYMFLVQCVSQLTTANENLFYLFCIIFKGFWETRTQQNDMQSLFYTGRLLTRTFLLVNQNIFRLRYRTKIWNENHRKDYLIQMLTKFEIFIRDKIRYFFQVFNTIKYQPSIKVPRSRLLHTRVQYIHFPW